MTRAPKWSSVVVAVFAALVALVVAPVTASAAATTLISSVSPGGTHTCALTTGGGVLCWGDNTYGALGDGTTTTRAVPVAVYGLTSGVAQVSTGTDHTCALTTGGGVKCWGRNNYGQLGDGTHNRHLTPFDVTGLTSGVSAISSGYNYTCALLLTGEVQCWGQNINGQLGDNTLVARPTPAAVLDSTGTAPLAGATAIAAGDQSTCALLTGGGIQCWGLNNYGQLGDTTTKRHKIPVDVTGLAGGATVVTVGDFHTCAITTAGGTVCWGRNDQGQVGDGTTKTRRTPTGVKGLDSGVVAIDAGGDQTCAVKSSGAVSCWGSNKRGQLGNGSGRGTGPATPVGLAGGAAAIGAGGETSCAVTTSGAARCWGGNADGQVGDGTRDPRRLVPMTVWHLIGSGTQTYQPDLSVAGKATGPYRGNGVYSAAGKGQTLRLNVKRGSTGRAFFSLGNDGSVADIVVAKATGLGLPRSPLATRFLQLRTDLTAGLRTGNYWTRLGSGKQLRLRATIKAKATATVGLRQVITLVTRSSHDPSKADTVRILVRVTR